MTLLIYPDKKATFERSCVDRDVTCLQMVSRLIREAYGAGLEGTRIRRSAERIVTPRLR
ncbi:MULTISPECIES: hypothetical protein [Methylocaldum]|uniref:hypothetical protein n=1 Tax=unclassified Methylocaldum TaxID=2622260 RepID=UPI003DA1C4EE